MTTIPALVTTFATEARGSVGAFTFSRNRDGPYVRARTVPTDPASPAQQAMRTRMLFASALWRAAVTPAEKALWQVYADNVPRHNALGQAINDQGRNWFLACDLQRRTAGHPSIRTPPAEYRRTHLGDFTAVHWALFNLIAILPAVGDEWHGLRNGLMILYQSPQLSAGINYYRGPWRYLGHIHGGDAFPANFAPVFPLAAPGQFRIRARALTPTNLYSRSVYARGTFI